ncbi:CCA tRNA nucleotidyltransferase [Isosphaeraceae bacterium EP7]
MSPTEARRDFAVEVVRVLRSAGYQALWAGGCVRDLILGREPTDYDVATNARPEQVVRLFRRTLSVGASFGVIMVLGPNRAGDVEVATFRGDGEYLDGRRPSSVHYGDARLDASRRDFTINGLFLDPETDEIIDYVGGRADLEAGVIRAIGDPRARFAEDKLRLLRAVRFAARLEMTIEPATFEAIHEMAGQVTVVAAERIAQELRRMLGDSHRAVAFSTLAGLGMLGEILPSMAWAGGQQRRESWLNVLNALDKLPESPSFPLALATLLHAVEPEADAARLVNDDCRALKLANDERERIVWLVASQAAKIEPGTGSESRLKRLLSHPGATDLLAFRRAIALATTGDDSAVSRAEAYLRDEPEGPINPLPILTGGDLIRHGLKPGPEFSGLLEAVRDAQLERRIGTVEDSLALVDRLRTEKAGG